MTGLGSVQIQNGMRRNGINQTNEYTFNSSSAYHNRKNIDRHALLEEIEKNKIEEIKLKTFKSSVKNSDKYKQPQPRQLVATTALTASNEMNCTLTTKFSIGTQNPNMLNQTQ